MIVIKVKYGYQRLGSLFANADAHLMLRSTDFLFDADPPIGQFAQHFERHRVNMLDFFSGRWYFLLQTRGATLSFETKAGWKEEWGPIQNGAGYKCWSLDKNGLALASINDLPDSLLRTNILMDYAPIGELASLDGTRVTLSQKANLLARYPVNPDDERILRPQTIIN